MQSVDLIQHIRNTAKKRGLSKYALAKLAGLDVTSLKDMDKDSWNPRFKTILKLERGLE